MKYKSKVATLAISAFFFLCIFLLPSFWWGFLSDQKKCQGNPQANLTFVVAIGCPFDAAVYYSKKNKFSRFLFRQTKQNHQHLTLPALKIETNLFKRCSTCCVSLAIG
jgi:amino acid permease